MNCAMKEGTYGINTCRALAVVATAISCFGGFYSCTGINMVSAITTDNTCTAINTSTLMVVDSVCQTACTAMISYMTHGINKTGCNIDNSNWTTVCVTLSANNWIDLGGGLGCIQLAMCSATTVKACDKTVINTKAATAATDSAVILTCSNDSVNFTCFATFAFNTTRVDRNSVDLKFFQVDNLKGTFNDADLTVTTDTFIHDESNAATFTVTKTTISDESVIGTIATESTKLRDIDKFWDASGNFILETPQTLTLVQGNGKTATLTISGADTIGDVKNKLNEAIANQLGQGCLAGVGSDTDKFASYVSSPCSGGLEAVQGTFVIRSAVAGKDGEISVVGSDAVIAALSLTTIQRAVNNNFTVRVTDAHSGNVVADNVKISENNLDRKSVV